MEDTNFSRQPRSLARQKRIYDFILAYKAAHDGNSPTMREIMAGCDITTTSIVDYYLTRMEREGQIIRRRSKLAIEIPGGRWQPPEIGAGESSGQ